MKEPLEFLLSKYKFDITKIKKIETGLKYTALMLKNGNIGVCANIGFKINTEINTYSDFDLNNISHRIVLTAYFNSLLNYSDEYLPEADIVEMVKKKNYKQITMIGFIKPVFEQLNKEEFKLDVFDLNKEDIVLTNLSKQNSSLQNADAVILSSTSVFNLTFIDVINATNNDCDIFILGPSSVMAKEMFEYRNIKMIFGATFKKFDEQVMNLINNNKGTKVFLKFGNKCMVKNQTYEI